MILVDSSALIPYLTGQQTSVAKILRKIEEAETPFSIPAICIQELLQGAANQKEWKLLERYLSSQIVASPEDPTKHHIQAARLSYLCRKKGYTIRSTIDCSIAQLAIENDFELLHNDRDFVFLAKISSLRELQKYS